ncbi:MAG: glycosyltransferase family 4 protein [Balneolaceae bacterium]
MRIAILSPIAWRTPPRHYGPWESVTSILTEELVRRGYDVTLYATGESLTAGKLKSVCPRGYEEDREIIPKVWECLHISALFEEADQYDIIHNHFDYLPLTYTGMTRTPVVSTIHGFSSPGILPVYRKYNNRAYYVSISNSDRAPDLNYHATVYHGLDLGQFSFQPDPEDYLLFFGRIHPEKGAREAIDIAKRSGRRLILAGIIQDEGYYRLQIEPELVPGRIDYIGSAGPSERNRLLGNAAALLHPIRFDEPFGLSVVEAMACGTPVIAFNRGSMPELIDHGLNGYLASGTDDAVQAVDRLDQVRRIDCREHVEQYFTVGRMADDYVEVYESVLKQTGNGKVKEPGYEISSDDGDSRLTGKREQTQNR